MNQIVQGFLQSSDAPVLETEKEDEHDHEHVGYPELGYEYTNLHTGLTGRKLYSTFVQLNTEIL